ncbi:hypothetical protein NIES2101_14010 [Calothrix sp. HK-06]|nr:hypothetical protein NIES2101_14010 [Calothrix sp. HK-06]
MKTRINQNKKRYKPNYQHLLVSLNLLLCTLGYCVKPAQAEGSKELVSDGGYRPYIEWADTLSAGIVRRTKLKVFVQKDEIVNLGSSVITSSNDNQDIVYRSLFGGQNGFCDVKATGEGLIDTVAKETNGPGISSGGYNPCTFIAKETGIYEVEFHAPATSADPPPKKASDQFPTDSSQKAGVAAWDITVKDSAGNTKKGRVFTTYIAMNMGANAGGAFSDLALNSKLYIQTKDGFRYETDMNGVDPYGFIFFGNSRGFIDKTNNSTLYHSAKAADNTLTFLGNIKVQNPDVPDTATDITHLIFFNRPDGLTLDALGIPRAPIAPAKPTNFKFTGKTGTSGNQTPVSAGGYFSFDSSTSGAYQIIIDTNTDGKYDPSTDRVLQNPVYIGNNVVTWDGKDAQGVDLLPRAANAPYNTQVTIRGGEYHFPMLDAENNPLGFRITMENPPTAFPNILDNNGQQIGANTVYYNNSNYKTADGTSVNLNNPGISNPVNAAMGINSSFGANTFNSLYGDFKGIDTWAYFPSETVLTSLVITQTNQANVKGLKSVRFVTDADKSNSVTIDDTVEYSITYSNLAPGNSDATNFVINDSLPSQLTFVSVEIKSKTNGNTITINSNYNGSGALTNSGTLRVGDSITIAITAKINGTNNGNAISNQASATFNTPDNPTSTIGTIVTDANSMGGTTETPTVGNTFVQKDDDLNTGNDPSSKTDDDPTLFKVAVVPNLRLVKRVTGTSRYIRTDKINGEDVDVYKDLQTINSYHDLDTDVNDNASVWSVAGGTNYLLGAINSSHILASELPVPKDQVQYTIYFLSDGAAAAKDVNICDFIPENQTYVPGSMTQKLNTGTETTVVDGSGSGSGSGYYAKGNASFPSTCKGTNNDGAVYFQIGDLTPNSFGFVRFRAKVK